MKHPSIIEMMGAAAMFDKIGTTAIMEAKGFNKTQAVYNNKGIQNERMPLSEKQLKAKRAKRRQAKKSRSKNRKTK